MKKKVLIIAGYYLPSVKGGGPIQSIKNIISHLSDEIDFYILAADRDLGDTEPFSDIEVEKWIDFGLYHVYYSNLKKLSVFKILDIIRNAGYDVIYLNSFFDVKLSVFPMIFKKMGFIQNENIILAPRGQFSKGALNHRFHKKNIMLKIVSFAGLYNNITWHATAQTEAKDIEAIWGKSINIQIASNLTENYKQLYYVKKPDKIKGELEVIFISRIHPKKNLIFALQLLREIVGKVKFDIYGPIEDYEYWDQCNRIIKELPESISVSYGGIIEHERVSEIFNIHQVLLFPTLGENYGHVISEALIGGCVVLISNQTPWRSLSSKGVGWDISLSSPLEFVYYLQMLVNMDEDVYTTMSKNAFNYAVQVSNRPDDIMAYRRLFGL